MSFFKTMLKGNSKHKKLSEEQALQNAKETAEAEHVAENDEEVVTFKLKYLGSTVVEKVSGDISTDAVKNIIKTAKASRKQQKKLQRVVVAISGKGIAVSDLQGNDIFKVSIYRISNCASDGTHRQVFSFISTDQNDIKECHAFLCSKRKMAETVTLAVAKAFSAAYQAWRVSPATQEFQNNFKNAQQAPTHADRTDESGKNAIVEEKLINFDSDGIDDDEDEFDQLCKNRAVSNNSWVCFDDDFVNGNAKLTHRNELILV
ncbi:low density lipoprotein receptor adapter protein 1-B-like [Cylas formicarius]|uniref:low density lipoprotein receptor adapter protein 1-B-like n=1 Tax=Cylas formicarius TaxID=197179 RepID=UPI00295850E3|nr:low density lipoprotein receptor adapter protein 1-B-like [Cylas formicarius]